LLGGAASLFNPFWRPMDKRNDPVLVLGVIAALLGFGSLLMVSRGCGKRPQATELDDQHNQSPDPFQPQNRPSHQEPGQVLSHSGSSGGQHSPGLGGHSSPGSFVTPPAGESSTIPKTPASPAVKARYEAMQNRLDSIRKDVREQSRKWGLNRINDQTLTAQTREVYRLRLIEPLHHGHRALENGNPREALQEYVKALKDPNASAVSRHITYDYMKEAAARLQDIELYVQIMRAQVAAIETEDLSVLSIPKTKDARIFVDDFEEHVLTLKDPVKFKSLVDKKMAGCRLTGEDREEMYRTVERETRERIESYREMFGDRT
jgi:hypothetical protein